MGDQEPIGGAMKKAIKLKVKVWWGDPDTILIAMEGDAGPPRGVKYVDMEYEAWWKDKYTILYNIVGIAPAEPPMIAKPTTDHDGIFYKLARELLAAGMKPDNLN
jgi:hypothetical protein